MPMYRVTWEIDVEEESPVKAAREAKRLQGTSAALSSANVFQVKQTDKDGFELDLGDCIDLDEHQEEDDEAAEAVTFTPENVQDRGVEIGWLLKKMDVAHAGADPTAWIHFRVAMDHLSLARHAIDLATFKQVEALAGNRRR